MAARILAVELDMPTARLLAMAQGAAQSGLVAKESGRTLVAKCQAIRSFLAADEVGLAKLAAVEVQKMAASIDGDAPELSKALDAKVTRIISTMDRKVGT